MDPKLYLPTIMFVLTVILWFRFKFWISEKLKEAAELSANLSANLTEGQMNCHGIWVGELQGWTFYLCIHEIGQFIEGIYFERGTQMSFSGSYIAPMMYFDILDEDGSTKSFEGLITADGLSISGKCFRSEADNDWSAKRLSRAVETKRLPIDVLFKVALTYMPPENEELRAKILADPDGLSIEDKVAYHAGLGASAVTATVPPTTLLEIGDSANQVVERQITPSQKKCQGVWEGIINGKRFNFCLLQTGHFIEGHIKEDNDVVLVTGSYNAPILRFEKPNADGSDVVFEGKLDATGSKLIGTCSNYAQSTDWVAELISTTVSASLFSRPIRELLSKEAEKAATASEAGLPAETIESPIVLQLSPPPMLVPLPAQPEASYLSAPKLSGQSVEVEKAAEKPTEITCSSCQSVLDPAFQFCLHCGHAKPPAVSS